MKKIIILIALFAVNSLHASKFPDKQQTGEAIVESIEKKAWWLEAGPELLGRGDYVMTIRIIQPGNFPGKRTLALRVVKKEDMIINGRMLEVGDTFAFEARDAFFERKIFGPTLNDLKNLRLSGAPKKPS